MLNFLKDLPLEIQDFIFGEVVNQANKKIADQFAFNQSQLDFILDTEEKIWLKQITPLDLPKELEQMERAQYYDLRALSLELALNILWPLQQYLGEVDRLILRLGGKVPRLQSLKSDLLVNKSLPDSVKGAIKFLLEQYPELKDKRLTSAKIMTSDGHYMMPTLENWLKDYIHFLGAGYHDSLERSKYLAKSPNVLALSAKEKDNLRCFLLSYDDDLPLLLDNSDVILQLTLLEAEKENADEKPLELAALVDKLQESVGKLKSQFLNEALVLSEAENSLYKLRDVLWESLAWQDQAKGLTCLKILLDKGALELLLQEDRRFQGLLRRFVDLKFGESVQWNVQDKLLVRRLFFEMILSSKLKLANQQAMLAAFYLTNLGKQSGQVVYLDQNSQQLKWRELAVNNNQIIWQDNG